MASVVSSFNAAEKQLIESSLKRFQIMSTAVAKLYFASPPDRNSWTYNFFGAITVVYDNAGSYFLKLLDIQNGSVKWEYPISKQLKYKEECNFFHSFYTDKFAAGLSFADEGEAKNFLRCVIQNMNQAQTPRSTKTASIISAPTVVPSTQSNKESKKEKKEKKEKKSKKGTKKKGGIDKSLISQPKDFRHNFHMGSEGLEKFTEYQNEVIEEAFKKIMTDSNITKEELMNDKNLKIISAFFSNSNNANTQSGTKSKAAPPPPPSRKAPPPIPSRSAGGKGAPPPPPSRNAPPPVPSRVPPPPSRSAPPPVPSRTPAPPSREAPAPPSRGAPPPPARGAPVPPPPARGAPAPPPMAAPGGCPPPPPPPPSGPIQPYRTEDPDAPPKPPRAVSSESDGRNDLLASIRNAGISSLRPASERQVKQIDTPQESNDKGDLAAALAMALLKRKDDMNDEDTEESSGDDDDDDDSEWSD